MTTWRYRAWFDLMPGAYLAPILRLARDVAAGQPGATVTHEGNEVALTMTIDGAPCAETTHAGHAVADLIMERTQWQLQLLMFETVAA